MSIENKQVLSKFIHKDRFELNAYLTYIFQQFNNKVPAELNGMNK
jgi:hypothetical protein